LLAFLAILVLFYSIYILLNHSGYWYIATVPLFTLVLLRYFTLVTTNTDFARHAEKLIFRKDLIILILLWFASFIFAIYKNKLF